MDKPDLYCNLMTFWYNSDKESINDTQCTVVLYSTVQGRSQDFVFGGAKRKFGGQVLKFLKF